MTPCTHSLPYIRFTYLHTYLCVLWSWYICVCIFFHYNRKRDSSSTDQHYFMYCNPTVADYCFIAAVFCSVVSFSRDRYSTARLSVSSSFHPVCSVPVHLYQTRNQRRQRSTGTFPGTDLIDFKDKLSEIHIRMHGTMSVNLYPCIIHADTMQQHCNNATTNNIIITVYSIE